MPIGSTNIKMSDINAEVSSVNSTSLTQLSTNAITQGNTIDGAAPHGMNEFAGYEHTSIGSFPGLGGWNTRVTASVGAGGWSQAHARCQIGFKNDTTNSRIIVSYFGGNAQYQNTVSTGYINYSGYTGNINVQYNAPSTHTFGGTSGITNPAINLGSSNWYPPYGWPGHPSNTSSSSYLNYTSSSWRKLLATNYLIPTSSYVYFKWMVRTSQTGYSTEYRSVYHSDVSFKVSFTSGGSTYSSTSSDKVIELDAFYGPIF